MKYMTSIIAVVVWEALVLVTARGFFQSIEEPSTKTPTEKRNEIMALTAVVVLFALLPFLPIF